MTRKKTSKLKAKKEVAKSWRWAGQCASPAHEVVAKQLMPLSTLTMILAKSDQQWDAASRILSAVSACVAAGDLAPLEAMAKSADKVRLAVTGETLDGLRETQMKDAMLNVVEAWLETRETGTDCIETAIGHVAELATNFAPKAVELSGWVAQPTPLLLNAIAGWRSVMVGTKSRSPLAYVSSVLRVSGLTGKEVDRLFAYAEKRLTRQ